MSKIVFFCIPAHGHTNPTLNVVRELIQAGHEIWYYSYDHFREKIESTGAKFISCNAYDAEQHLRPEDATRVGKDIAFSTKILVNTTLALDDMVCRDMEKLKPDCIVADSMAFWGKAIALKLGIPFVSSTTTFAFNQYSARIMKQSISQLFNMVFSMPKINKDLKRLQAKGYPVKNILSLIQNDNDTDTIVYTSREFQPCADTFSAKYAFVGPSIRAAETVIEKSDKKLIYISMGTVNNLLIQFYKNCIQAFKNSEHEVILSVGDLVKTEELGEIPANFQIFSHVDQIAVLQKADVFISHCGMNSATESLYHEVPLVLFPHTTEQGGVARRIADLGAGAYLEKNTVDSIQKTVDTVLHTPSYKENAAKIADSFRSCGGAASAAEKILQVAAAK